MFMSYIPISATDEALLEIAEEMRIANNLELLRELRNCKVISTTEYIESLKELAELAELV
jgi:hypothetical protein